MADLTTTAIAAQAAAALVRAMSTPIWPRVRDQAALLFRGSDPAQVAGELETACSALVTGQATGDRIEGQWQGRFEALFAADPEAAAAVVQFIGQASSVGTDSPTPFSYRDTVGPAGVPNTRTPLAASTPQPSRVLRSRFGPLVIASAVIVLLAVIGGVFLFSRVPGLAQAAQGTYDCTVKSVTQYGPVESNYVLEIGDGTWKETWEHPGYPDYTQSGTWRIEDGKLVLLADPIHDHHVTKVVVIDGVPNDTPETFHGVVPRPTDPYLGNSFEFFDVTISNGGRHVEFTTDSAEQLHYVCDRR